MTKSSARETKKILVTRSLHQANEFCMKIKECNFEPVILPLIKVTPVLDTTEVEKTLKNINKYSWIIFTSKNGVNSFFDFLSRFNYKLGNPKFACVGDKTEQELNKYGFSSTFIPTKFHAEAFVAEVFNYITMSDYVLVVKGSIARKVIPEALKENKINFDEVIVYDTVTDNSKKHDLLNLLENKEIDIITFTSPSAIESFKELTVGLNTDELLKNVKIAVIGPSSKKSAIENGYNPEIMPSKYTLDGMLNEIENEFLRSVKND
ncbi:MAG: uroporphyrinogen-III synthase HemD family protein [Bacillales bacterium]|jgi:uroporphyrinogen-III synthase|nr:uroporphyrinogen-III synthase HemD family protein [Bacillales bacterium]